VKKFAKILGTTLAVVAGLVALLIVVSRFSDGPMVELLPGGPLTTGEIVTSGPIDWSFVSDHLYVEFESDGRSRKTYILTADGHAYIPASLDFPPFKTWHKKALENPEAVIRIAGKRYPRRLQKIDDPALEARLKEQAKMKYGGGPDPQSGAWFFRLDPPSS
jgi:hypothetical protein